MRELQLIRRPDDKRRLDLDGVGSIRFENLWGTKLVLTATGGEAWRIERRRKARDLTATDGAGAAAATFTPGGIEHADVLVQVATPDRGLLERRPPFVIVERGREIARVAPKVWDEKPLDVTVLDEEFVAGNPLLFLCALYQANLVASSRQAGAAAGGVT
jgi:hypothetical protein